MHSTVYLKYLPDLLLSLGGNAMSQNAIVGNKRKKGLFGCCQ